MKPLLALLLVVFLFGCSGTLEPPLPTFVPTPSFPTPSPSATSTKNPIPTSTPTPTSTTQSYAVCSPLSGISLGEMSEIVSNPFQAPRPGQDDGHHGTDFAFYRYKTLTTMEGLPVQAVLPGVVAASIQDRPPYGNMLIVETSLDQIPAGMLNVSPHMIATVPAISSLTCPNSPTLEMQSTVGWSLYLLYAHLREPPDFGLEDKINCGQTIDQVGNTGMSGNPHLHLEVRFGPAGVRFTSMSHYNTAATEEEMQNYCTWRVSGEFQPIDPLKFIQQAVQDNNSSN